MNPWKTTPEQRYTAVLALGVALRLGLFCTSLPSVLERRPELSSPITSFRSLKEGVYIYEKGSNPYDGGIFYHSPIYLWWFTHVIPLTPILTAGFWTLLDVVGVLCLVTIARSRAAVQDRLKRDAMVAALYLLNPYILMTCLARSTTAIDNVLVLTAITTVANGRPLGMGFLALASHTSVYPILFLPPLLMLAKKQSSTSAWTASIAFLGTFAAICTINQVVFGNTWWQRTWTTIITVSDLTPNVGMWWYFFTEMFDHFRNFFIGVFQLHPIIYVTPICLRLQHDPLFAVVVLVGVISTWKSYPTLGDIGLWAGLVGCYPDIIQHLRHPLFTLTVYLYTLILLPLLHSLWLLTGTGNANFFYAATMVHGLNSSLAVVDVLTAGLKRDVKARIEVELAPEEKEVTWKPSWKIVQFTKG